jgi:hypothetical protein
MSITRCDISLENCEKDEKKFKDFLESVLFISYLKE